MRDLPELERIPLEGWTVPEQLYYFGTREFAEIVVKENGLTETVLSLPYFVFGDCDGSAMTDDDGDTVVWFACDNESVRSFKKGRPGCAVCNHNIGVMMAWPPPYVTVSDESRGEIVRLHNRDLSSPFVCLEPSEES